MYFLVLFVFVSTTTDTNKKCERDGVVAARALAEAIGAPIRAPWLMMSINDDEEDPHFRKAAFDPALCPSGELAEGCPISSFRAFTICSQYRTVIWFYSSIVMQPLWLMSKLRTLINIGT